MAKRPRSRAKSAKSGQGSRSGPPATKSGGRPPQRGTGGARRGSRGPGRSSGGPANLDPGTEKLLSDWNEQAAKLKAAPPIDFTLDPWQQEAVDRLLQGDSIVVDAPTSAGKTVVAEQFLKERMHEPGFRMVYTAPVKSLSNDKLFEMRAKFGHENVGITTGDYKENLHAPIVVATLESYRNAQLGTDSIPPPTIVVFDEYHYIGESSRGSAWEESIILTPPETQMLLLSASVLNAPEFCEWIGSLKNRPCYLVRTEHRPVPLEHLVFNGQAWVHANDLAKNWKRKLNARTMRYPIGDEDLATRLAPLIKAKLTPFILYAGRRLAVETAANALAKSLEMLPLERRQEMEERLQKIHGDFQSLSFLPPSLRNMIVTKGIAYHHSGLAPPARILVEKLLKQGELQACVATMGLSLGINFAVRSAVITDYRRPDEKGFVDYSESEVLQMLGRAGRRGSDLVGFSIWPSLESFYKMGHSKRQACVSNFKVEPITLMGLVHRGFSPGRVESFYKDSFGSHMQKQGKMTMIRPERLLNRLKLDSLPCRHPALDLADFFVQNRDSKCFECPQRKQCHPRIHQHKHSILNRHYTHLLRIGCIDFTGGLTAYGKIARFFPQAGGLLFADRLVSGQFSGDKLMRAAQLAGALALAAHKSPLIPDSYNPPFDAEKVDEELRKLYPKKLFPDYYDVGNTTANGPQIREFNPSGSFVVKKWLDGCTWKELEYQCTHERFGAGDLMNLLYRVGTYLQSIAQLRDPTISPGAAELRSMLLRDPMGIAINPIN